MTPGAQPRTVLYLAWAPFFSGAERALLLTLQALDPRRYVPHVIVGTDGPLRTELEGAGIATDVVPLAHLGRDQGARWARSAWAIWRLARRLRPALIHSNDVPSFQPGGHVARWMRVPALTHVRFPDSDAGFRWFLRPGFTRALFVSDALRSDAMAAAPSVFGGKADVVHDGVVIPPEVSPATREQIRTELGLPANAPVVALTGQVSEVKGIWDFVDAATELGAANSVVRFAVLGDDLKSGGALRRAMESRVAERGLGGRFHFLGFRTDAPRLIPAFDIVTVPSHIEPLGNATLEAMAAGVPVVGSRVGGIPEMVEENVTGLLVPARNPSALAAALRDLVDAPERRQAFGRAARRRAVEWFGLPRHAERLQGLYDEVLLPL